MTTDSNKPLEILTLSELRKREQNLLDAINAAAPERERLEAERKAAHAALSEVIGRSAEMGVRLDDEVNAAQARLTKAESALRADDLKRREVEKRRKVVQEALRLTEQREASALRARLLPIIEAELPKAKEALVQAVARVGALIAIRDGIPAGMFDPGVVAKRAAGEVGGALAARIAEEIAALKRSARG